MTDLLGVLRKAPDGTATVHFDRFFPVEPQQLWNVVTHPGELGEWFATVEGDLFERGVFSITFEHRGPEKCRIIACAEPRMFSFEWAVPQPTLVTVHLIPETWGARGCRVELTHERLSTADGPRYAAGWDSYLHVLADHLAGAALRSWADGAEAVRVAYRQQIMD